MLLFPSTRKSCETSRSRSSADEILSLPEGCNTGLFFRTWYCSSSCLPYVALFRFSDSCECHPRVTLLYLTVRIHISLFPPPASNITLHMRMTTVSRSKYCQRSDISLPSSPTPIIVLILVSRCGYSQPSQTYIHSSNFDNIHSDIGYSFELYPVNHSTSHRFPSTVFHSVPVTDGRVVSHSKYSQRYYPSPRSSSSIHSTRAIQRVRLHVLFPPKGSRFRKQQYSVYSSSHIVQVTLCTLSPHFCNHKIRIYQSFR